MEDRDVRDLQIQKLRELDQKADRLRVLLGLSQRGEDLGNWGEDLRITADGYGGEWLIEYRNYALGESNFSILHEKFFPEGVPDGLADRLYDGDLEWDGNELVENSTRPVEDESDDEDDGEIEFDL